MASLRVIPYEYVPTKRQHNSKQQGKLCAYSEKVLQSSTATTPGDLCGVGEPTRHDNVYETIVNEPARREIQDLASVPSTEVSLSSGLDLFTLGGETGCSQVEFTENGTVDIDPLSDFDSIFGDINALFEEHEVSSVIECRDDIASNSQTDVSAGQIDSLMSENEFRKSDTLSSGSAQSMRQRINTKRRRGEGNSSVTVDESSSGEGGTSDESNDESMFEGRRSKRPKSRFRDSSPDSSICCSDIDQSVTKLAPRLNSHPLPIVDFIERRKDRASTENDNSTNPVQDVDPQIDDSDVASDDGDDELCRSPSWYRFGASATTAESTKNTPDCARPCYVAQVEDAYREREFHNIIGKEYIDGEVYYLVDWVPTLVRGHILRKAQAQPLISSFEARCQSYKEGGNSCGDDLSDGYEATDEIQQRKRRGRPRNQM